MAMRDRIGRALFAATAVGLGWGIRGDFGHLVGAMYPGAALGLAFAYVGGRRSLLARMPVIASLSAFGIATGGSMSYGILHGYAQSDTFINYAYGFLTLFLQGSAWGAFAGALIGLVLEKRPMRTGDWLGWLASIFLGGWITSYAVVTLLKFDINPPRSNGSIAFMGAAIGQFLWLCGRGRPIGLRGAFFGYVGFGLGMSIGRLLGNAANVLQQPLGITINHWNVMEVSCGFIGGLIFCLGMPVLDRPEPSDDEEWRFASVFGMIHVLGLIPLWHRLNRIDAEKKLMEWAGQLKSFGYADPNGLSRTVLSAIDATCVLGFFGVAVWGYLHFKHKYRLGAIPVLWLSGTMLLFQNLNALYFFYPRVPGQINMHSVFWIMFIAMLLYAGFVGPRLSSERSYESESNDEVRGLGGWIAGTAIAFGITVILAGFINGDRTMTSANTRWPVWSWNQGRFPGR